MRSILLVLIYSASAWATEVVPGEFLVQFKKNVHFVQEQYLLNTISIAQVVEVSKETHLYKIRRPSIESMEGSLEILSSIKQIGRVEPNKYWKLRRMPQDPVFHRLWGLNNIGQETTGDTPSIKGVIGVDIDILRVWETNTGSRNVKVAVIDTGINYNHADLKQNIWTNYAELDGWPGQDDDNNGCIDDIHGCDFVHDTGDPMDDDGHGTHVAGTIGAVANNNVGVAGIAWEVTLIPVKFIDDQDRGTTENAIRAIDYAVKAGARILSNSWGDDQGSDFLKQSIERAERAGALFVVACGNDSRDNDVIFDYPSSYEVDNIIAVAAVDNSGDLASFSNYGKKSVDIAAPGSNVMSTYYDPKLPGLTYDSQSGTSMATPHVSGVAALMLAKNQTLTPQLMKKIIMDSARPMPALKGKVLSNGMLNAYEALKLVP